RNAAKALRKLEQETELLEFFENQFYTIEKQLKLILDKNSQNSSLGVYLRTIVGVGPVVAGGLTSFLNIEKAPSPGSFVRFAGFDPTSKWEKGQIRPWNATLKRVVLYAMRSMWLWQNHKSEHYGSLLRMRFDFENQKNENFEFKDQATQNLIKFNYAKDTVSYREYSKGKLPTQHIIARAKRWAAKIFLCHVYEVAYWLRYGIVARRPYSFDLLGHPHIIIPPNSEFDPRFLQALKNRSPVMTTKEYAEHAYERLKIKKSNGIIEDNGDDDDDD
ncbi:MAG: hypothetical protein KGL95_10290, partial [Patescibacteria group bacterium]|nr:hypothetical protein [Patescibacteria group bacterium]